MAGNTSAANPKATIMYRRYHVDATSVIRAGRSISQKRHAMIGLIVLLTAVVTPSNTAGQAALAPVIKHQFWNNSGAICSGCKLYSFAAGTTTPLSTYTTSALSVANPNPTILDSSGRVAGSSGIFLTAASYKFELTTAADVSLWVMDNVADVKYLAVLAVAAVTQTSTSTGTLNGFALSDNATFLRMNNATLATFTGFAAGDAGQVVDIVSVGAGRVDFANENTNSVAADRIIVGVGGAAGVISLSPGVGRLRIVYDGTTSRWRVLEHEQGAWITPTFAAGDYTAATGTWTVDSGDVTTCKYWLKGHTLHVIVRVETSDVSATPATLNRVIPGGFTATNTSLQLGVVVNAGAAAAAGANSITAGSTSIAFYATAALGAWSTTSSDNTLVDFARAFEVN